MLKTTAILASAVLPATLWSTGPLAASRDAVLAKFEGLALVVLAPASDGVNRMRLAGRVPMLTERVAAASCALASGVDVETSRARLAQSMHEMDVILHALREGDEAVGVHGAETDRRLTHDVNEMAAAWAEAHGAAEAVLSDAADAASAREIDERSRELVELGTTLSADFVAEYADPYALTKADALLLKIAGRQKTFTQRMAKAACEIWTGFDAEAGRAELGETMGFFDASLRALRHGAPDLGLAAAPTPEIAEALDEMIARWDAVRVELDALVAGEEIGPEGRHLVFHELDVELKAFDDLLLAYQDHARRGR